MTDNEIRATIDALNAKDDYDGIIDFIATLDNVDFDCALQLARAHINKANRAEPSYAYKLYLNASDILDTYAQKGKDSPSWLFYKGYTLFKLNLVSEALIRFERAMRFVTISDGALFNQIGNMLKICKTLEARLSETLSDDDLNLIDEHIQKHFGSYSVLSSSDSIDLIDVAPTESHNYHVIMTKGLSAFLMDVPDGFDKKSNARIELAIALPLKWDKSNTWSFELLRKLSMLLKSGNRFLGFGFTLDNEKAFAKNTAYTGAMLTALGDYSKESQAIELANGDTVNIFQVVPLMPMEVAYRQKHQAQELLDLFKLRHVVLSPLVDGREDVCQSISAKSV